VLAVILRFLLALRPILESRVWNDHGSVTHGGHVLHDNAHVEHGQQQKDGVSSSVGQVRYDISSRWAEWRVNDAAGRATYELLVAGVGYLL
jgi:hypothetical protein